MSNMAKNSSVEDALDATRIKLYEQTKNMTVEERVDFFNKGAKEILARHGVKANFAKAPAANQQG